MKPISFFLLSVACTGTLALFCGVSAQAQTPVPATSPVPAVANRAEALLKLDAEVSKLSETAGAEKAFETYLAPDAVSPMAEIDQPADRATFIDRLKRADAADLVLKWTPLKGDLASSGDFGYTYGKWSVGRKDGGEVMLHGFYTNIWKKGADGAWKAVFLMGNQAPE